VSALASSLPHVRAFGESDLDRITEIETAIYTHPWTRGNFVDSIKAGYTCHAMQVADELIGYGVMMVAVREAHLLNLSVASEWQRKGYGTLLLRHFIGLARRSDALQMLLEVRISNVAGRSLYTSMGFYSLAVRPGYYPATHGREDAILMGLNL
jgi:ribosomal-protein-alanine N-acetyltransferase